MDLAATSNTQRNLAMSDIASLQLPLPPLGEQRRIADFLDDQVARIDAIADARRAQGNLLSLELIQTAFALANGLDDHVTGHPVVASQGKVPFKNRAVRALAAAVAQGHDGDFVARGLFSDRKGSAGGPRLDDRCATVFALEALVALHTARRVVAGFAFFK